VVPEREEGETAGRYLERLEANNADRSAIAGYLTKTGDPFLQAVLRSYMRKFAFYGDPIDMALRKLLMQVELPKETQQIDRVIQGFADRYHECNPGIYVSAGTFTHPLS
jgi:Sec7-like guanine-nucleotide exchange factor